VFLSQAKLRILSVLIGCVWAAAISACTAKTAGPNIIEDAGVSQQPDSTIPPDQFAISSHALVRFKRVYRIQQSLARALDLSPDSVCIEANGDSCFKLHEIGLGGVAPYSLAIYDPSENTGVSTPIIVDRIILSACRNRVDLDFATSSSALIFGSLDLDADGGLESPESASSKASIGLLYQRLLSRDASDTEIEQLVKFYAEVEAESSNTKARDWALLSCYMVASSLEWLFY
jgi:hypothetical protein